MNNDAFQKMVRERAGGKSTKEIARQAVEAEFQRKKKRGRRGGGRNQDYDSDSDDDNQKNHGRDKKKNKSESSDRPELLLRPQQVKGDDGLDESQYRDRAKERREGTTIKSENLGTEDSEMDLVVPSSKKGLDFSLLKHQKEEREQDTEEIDIYKLQVSLPTMEEARKSLQEFLEDPDMYTNLLPGLSEYLTQFALSFDENRPPIENIVCGVAGRNLQRSRLAMSMEAYPSNHARAWEIPREMVNPSANPDKREINFLDTGLLRSIDNLFAKNSQRPAVPPPQTSVSATSTKRKSNHSAGGKSKAVEKESVNDNIKADDSDDDDDDIFGGLEEYVPPKPKESET